jgi:hypothetical protein
MNQPVVVARSKTAFMSVSTDLLRRAPANAQARIGKTDHESARRRIQTVLSQL